MGRCTICVRLQRKERIIFLESVSYIDVSIDVGIRREIVSIPESNF